MDETANNGGEKRQGRAKAALPPEALALISRLDREIEELRQRASSGDDPTIAGLREAMQAIHDAIDGPILAKRR